MEKSKHSKIYNNFKDKSCKYFLKGACSFGDKCHFFHAPTLKKLLKPSEFSIRLNYDSDFAVSDKEIKQYNIKLDIPFQIQDPDNELILIRHGLSTYNFASQEFFFATGISFKDPGAKAYQTNSDLIDADLHPYGVIMCENNSKYLRNIEFDAVFVSPLGRAIQTTYHLFKSHPKKSQIKFIVLPQLAEILSKVQDISDIEKQREKYGKEFDFSWMEKDFNDDLDAWQITNMTDSKRKQYLMEEYLKQKEILFTENNNHKELESEDQQDKTNSNKSIGCVQKILLNAMDASFPSAIEKVGDTYQRAILARERILQYFLDQKIDPRKKKIGIISHNAFLQSFTAKGVSETGYVFRGDGMENCEIKSVSIYKDD